MIVRVVLREEVRFSDEDAGSPPNSSYVDITGEGDLSWTVDRQDEYNSFLVIYNEEAKREEARFVNTAWRYVVILSDEDPDEDGPDYTS